MVRPPLLECVNVLFPDYTCVPLARWYIHRMQWITIYVNAKQEREESEYMDWGYDEFVSVQNWIATLGEEEQCHEPSD